MSALLTIVVALSGAVLVTWGWARYLRGRFRARDRASAVTVRRSGVVMAVGGGLLLLLPEVPSHLLSGGSGSTGAESGFGEVATWVWRVGVLAGLTVVYGSMALLRERVTRPLREAVGRGAATVLSLAPVGPVGGARRMRRMPHLADFPRDRDGLLEYDRALTRRLLDYERDLELGANLPAMRDHTVPTTIAVWAAMGRCDTLRTLAPTGRVVEVLATDYGRAVADFALALATAEENARRLASDTLSGEEVAALAEVERLLAFVRSSHTTPAERAAAYDELTARLDAARPEVAPVERSHPWLDLSERVVG